MFAYNFRIRSHLDELYHFFESLHIFSNKLRSDMFAYNCQIRSHLDELYHFFEPPHIFLYVSVSEDQHAGELRKSLYNDADLARPTTDDIHKAMKNATGLQIYANVDMGTTVLLCSQKKLQVSRSIDLYRIDINIHRWGSKRFQ